MQILNVEYRSNRLLDHTQTLYLDLGDQRSVEITQMKTTSYGREPQNIKKGIYQQPLIGSYSKKLA